MFSFWPFRSWFCFSPAQSDWFHPGHRFPTLPDSKWCVPFCLRRVCSYPDWPWGWFCGFTVYPHDSPHSEFSMTAHRWRTAQPGATVPFSFQAHLPNMLTHDDQVCGARPIPPGCHAASKLRGLPVPQWPRLCCLKRAEGADGGRSPALHSGMLEEEELMPAQPDCAPAQQPGMVSC